MIHKLFLCTFFWVTAGVMPLLAAVGLAACTRTTPPDSAQVDEIAYGNFRTAVASVPNRQFQVYWLGREFTAGAIVFRGPYFVPIGGVVNNNRLDIEYSAGLTIRLYSQSAWATAAPTIEHPSAHESKRRSVVVGGRSAVLLTGSVPGRPINYQQLIIDFGDTVVTVVAGSGGAATPGGPDSNPLIDEQTFLSVMEQLRPYPQGGSATPALDPSFLTAVATVPHRQYTIYWLGPEFTADGVTFNGPNVPGIGAVDEQSMEMQYVASSGGGGAGIQFMLFSPQAWSVTRDRVRFPSGAAHISRKTVSVAGQDAELIFEGTKARPLNDVIMIIEFPDAAVVATAYSGGVAVEGRSDINPLVDEATLVSVMNTLRPYPQ